VTVRCDTTLYGQSYAIPEQSICSDLSPEKCPINNITRYTYTVKFNIPYFVPPVPSYLQFVLSTSDKFRPLIDSFTFRATTRFDAGYRTIRRVISFVSQAMGTGLKGENG
jgi:hypothetical protein